MIKDTHRENTASNTYTQIKFSKNEVVSGKSPLFVIATFCNPH